MSGKIVVLPVDLTNKIAAGEVVERPASIVKELLENALDAGATDITIELERGGCGAVRIVDNGEGMEPADVLRSFERYATSKIYEFDDIYKVTSFGFRGEALPSIASISRVEMISKKQGALTGMKVTVENGRVIESAEAGCPGGTSITVDHIFDAVPVRKKFLKSDTTEQGNCMDVITRMALAHPEVRIKVIARGRMLMNIPATKSAAERVSLVLGADFMDQILPAKGSENDIYVEGFVSRADFTRASGKQIYIFVNKRFIRDYLINHAVMTAYGRLIEARRYPAAVLFLEIPTEDVDVNVHPTKMEVRFRNPRNVYDAVYKILTGVLAESAPASDLSSYSVSSFQARRPGSYHYPSRMEEALKRYTVSSGPGKLFFDKGFAGSAGKTTEAPRLPAPRIPFTEISDSEDQEKMTYADLTYIGQAGNVYLIFQSTAGILIMDQHAAHERVLFEKLKRQANREGQKAVGQNLLIPEILSLTPKDYAFLIQEQQAFAQAGIEIEPFGSHEIAVKTVPALLSHMAPKALIMDMIEEFSETERIADPKEKQDKIFAVLACKGAVKANQSLSAAEAAALCRSLDDTPFSSTCPHGRPIYIVFSFPDLEKMFKRR
ncbi:MAG: DNA mismatch repair endonuclease MutL [Deltaproteobacteria bacterium]|nr:DNA mismatch repair endonuclease MutL [Deltaproteobacteria bacterium]